MQRIREALIGRADSIRKRAMMDRAAKSLHPDSTIRRITGYTYRLPVPVGKIKPDWPEHG